MKNVDDLDGQESGGSIPPVDNSVPVAEPVNEIASKKNWVPVILLLVFVVAIIIIL